MTQRPLDNCYWVVPGRFLAGEYPGSDNRIEAKDKIERLLRFGVNCFIDLTHEDDGLEPYQEVLQQAEGSRGIRLFKFPIPDVSVPRSRESAASILDAIDEAMQRGEVVYLHCWGGVGRTGVVVGCWLARHGQRGQSALDSLQLLWQQCGKSRFRKSPETREQEDFVRAWVE